MVPAQPLRHLARCRAPAGRPLNVVERLVARFSERAVLHSLLAFLFPELADMKKLGKLPAEKAFQLSTNWSKYWSKQIFQE